jgi:hypothetical protein
VVDGGEESFEALLGADSVGGAVYRAECFLEAPGLGEDWVAFEQFGEPATLALGEPLRCFQESVA